MYKFKAIENKIFVEIFQSIVHRRVNLTLITYNFFQLHSQMLGLLDKILG